MTLSKVENENDEVIKIFKDGNLIWSRAKTVQRTKISQESKDRYRNASTVEEKVDELFHIITGEKP